ncbi:MAG: cytochrome c peroxidase [Gammaproteobacteria bacterium]|nr:cytochrome c peroxidase [Gammaproteobacteria bacterium]
MPVKLSDYTDIRDELYSVINMPLVKKLCSTLCLFFLLILSIQAAAASGWNKSELALLKLQWLGSLPALPADPTNKFADDPAAAKLGQKLFFDSRFSANGKVACATCHVPEKHFTDGLAKSIGVGEASRSAPSIPGIAYSPWFFWDGHSDSLWSQALGPLESAVEHGGDRSQYARIIYTDQSYKKTYESLFGGLPDLSNVKRFPTNAGPVADQTSNIRWQAMSETDRKAITRVFVNIGKAIAAYERLLMPAPSRFDQYVEALLNGDSAGDNILTNDEVAGLKLFVGKAMCITCHQGPLFTNNGFHNVGVPDPATIKPKYLPPIFHVLKDKPAVDEGRYRGIRQALKSEFNCLNEYSDAKEDDCAELKFANTKHTTTLGAFKVPSLRNVAETAPYMHSGQFSSLTEVLQHYNTAPKAHIGHNELLPLNLQQRELEQIEAFLHSLSSPAGEEENLLRQP